MTQENGKVVSFPGDFATFEDVRERVQRLVADEGLTHKAVARESGVSVSTLSVFLSDKYKGKKDAVARELKKWLDSRSKATQMQALLPGVPAWIETPTAKRIYDALTYAQGLGSISVIFGGAGLSKTTTIRRYGEKNPNVWIVTASPAISSVAVVLQEIASRLGSSRDLPLHPAALQHRIVKDLTGTRGLLVIDEAQRLNKMALEQVRALHDATGIGLALAGNADVYKKIHDGGDNGFAQLFSRVGRRVELIRPRVGDVHAIAAAYGVRDKASLALCEEVARSPGALRSVVQTLRLAATFARDETIDESSIGVAVGELRGSAGWEVDDYV